MKGACDVMKLAIFRFPLEEAAGYWISNIKVRTVGSTNLFF